MLMFNELNLVVYNLKLNLLYLLCKTTIIHILHYSFYDYTLHLAFLYLVSIINFGPFAIHI